MDLRIAMPGGQPADAVRITALPYDPGRLLDSLDRAAPTPKPAFPDLERALAAYAPADPTEAEGIIARWRALRAPVETLADSLREADPASPGYAAAYDRFRRMYEDLRREEASLERTYRSLAAADIGLARRAQAAADSLRGWEDTAYAQLEAAAAAAVEIAGRETHTLVTDADGRVTARLAPGDWWLVGRYPHPTNPFLEYAWTVAFTVTRLAPAVVPITAEHVTLRWRH